MAKKVCKKCKMFVEAEICPNCSSSSFTNSWQGRFFILDNEKSEIAKKINVKTKGEYAIKAR